jgi:hypothetical protein
MTSAATAAVPLLPSSMTSISRELTHWLPVPVICVSGETAVVLWILRLVIIVAIIILSVTDCCTEQECLEKFK